MIKIYQYFAWILFTPLSFLLWGKLSNNDTALFICLLPIVWAYILPGLGTNYFKLWEFNVKGKIGRFKLQHGFVFGSATALLSGLCYFLLNVLISKELFIYVYIGVSIVFLTLINVYYDYIAIKKNIIFVYNKPWSEGKGAWEITKDYAIHIFGCFFLLYIPMVVFVIERKLTIKNNLNYFLFFELLLLFCPVIIFCIWSKVFNGVWGLFPEPKRSDKAKMLGEL